MGDGTISRRATIVDIAREAGVSPKTVSRVLNDEPHVKQAVRERVKQVAAAMNYHPNVAARGLITRRSYLIGLTYERPGPSYVVELQRGALERLEGEAYRLIVLPFHHASQRPAELASLLRSTAVDGVVLAPPASDLIELLDALDEVGIKYTRIAPYLALDRGAYATMDDVAAAHDVAEHVLGLGHRKIGIIKGDPTHHASEARLEGYRIALEAHGLSLADVAIAEGDFTLTGGETAAHSLLARKDRPTAILAQNDDMAIATILAARDLGLEVPRDLSVTGFDDSRIARLSWPRLTTVRQPVSEMSGDATGQLLRLLEGKQPDPPRVHAHRLQIRQSTASPRG